MSFPKIIVTQQGRNLLAKAFTGGQVQFTRYEIGSGECGNEEDWEYLSGLINKVMEVDISAYTREGDQVTFSGEFMSTAVQEAFWWSELAIFAKDVEDDESEIMCFYGNAGDYAELVPAYGAEVSVVHRWETTLMISSTADISAVISSTTYATSKQLNDHTQNTNNPHAVTKDQVGLGNVENLAPKDLTPGAFTVPTVLTELNKDDTLLTLFGKVAKLIKDFFAHLSNFANPHKVTWKNSGAPPSNHRSAGTTYGMGNSLYFGHVKLSDAINGEQGAADGVAASSKAVNVLYKLVKQARNRSKCGQVEIEATAGTACYATVTFNEAAIAFPHVVATPLGDYGGQPFISAADLDGFTIGIVSDTDRTCTFNWVAVS